MSNAWMLTRAGDLVNLETGATIHVQQRGVIPDHGSVAVVEVFAGYRCDLWTSDDCTSPRDFEMATHNAEHLIRGIARKVGAFRWQDAYHAETYPDSTQ